MIYKGKETIGPIATSNESIEAYTAGTTDSNYAAFYEYNGFNQLTKAIESDKIITYTYNGDGLRLSKTVSTYAGGASTSVTTNHIWDGDNIVAETDASGSITAKYIRGLNLIALADANGANIRYYLYNAHGDTTFEFPHF